MNKDYVETLLKKNSPYFVARQLGVETWELRLYMKQNGIEYKISRKPNTNSHIKKLIKYFQLDPKATPAEASRYLGCNRGLASTVKTVMDETKK